ASATLSVKPASRLCRVPGTQIVPAEVAVVPPTRSDFSQSNTSRPSSEPTKAAVMPAAPAPTTSTSTSSSPCNVLGMEIGISPPIQSPRAPAVEIFYTQANASDILISPECLNFGSVGN